MSSFWPVYIASKGRPEGKTMELLQAAGVPYKLFVEPEEVDVYRAAHADVNVLPKGGQGVGFVRQFILDFARAAKLDWYWMMDDDISGFYTAVDRRNVRSSIADILKACQKKLEDVGVVAQAALEYQQYAWAAKENYKFGSYCDVCVAINVHRTKTINYRPHLRLKEDRDFTLQILCNTGYQTMRFSKFSFSVPKNGSNKGGCQDDYQTKDRELQHSKKMVEIWPGICSLNFKSDGRPDVKINWALFKPKP